MPAGAIMKIRMLGTKSLMQATGPAFDAFSYHFYGAVSRRCGGHVTVEQALSNDWLNRTDEAEAFYAGLRAAYLPRKPMWLTETGEAACGGDPLAREFVDTFRFLNQLGTLAQKGVKVVMHNTITGSDYGLLSQDTYQPRPDYWAALLWKREMGTTVLDPGVPDTPHLRIYAQCLKGKVGGVSLLVLNTDRNADEKIELPVGGKMYTLTSSTLTSSKVLLNGTELKAKSDGALPRMHGSKVRSGTLPLPPVSVSFIALPSAHNAACH